MKSFLYSVVIALVALDATAGITYDFRTTTSGLQASEQNGHVSVDGTNLRMEFVAGDGAMFQDGAVAISHNAGGKIDVLDSQNKTYWELDIESLKAGAIADMVKMSNEKVDVKDAGDGGKIEGYPTQHKIVTASADMTVGNAPAMRLELTMESWTTEKIPVAAAAFFQRHFGSTGLPMLDKLIAVQSDQVKGFPLKQVTNIKVVQPGGAANMEMTSTTSVTNVKTKAIAPALFTIPADYKKTQNPLEKIGQ